MSLTKARPEPSAAWNMKLILARGGVSLVAGSVTTSSNTTANFIDARVFASDPSPLIRLTCSAARDSFLGVDELVAPSPQPCSVDTTQESRIRLVVRRVAAAPQKSAGKYPNTMRCCRRINNGIGERYSGRVANALLHELLGGSLVPERRAKCVIGHADSYQ